MLELFDRIRRRRTEFILIGIVALAICTALAGAWIIYDGAKARYRKVIITLDYNTRLTTKVIDMLSWQGDNNIASKVNAVFEQDMRGELDPPLSAQQIELFNWITE